MQYLISYGLILASLINKKSKIILFVILGTMWILFGFNTNNADYINYELIYNGYYPNHEIGFMKLISLFKYYNLSYQIFLIIVSFIGLLFLKIIIKQYTININYVIALYFIYPFFLDITQIRNFIAMIIFLFSIKYLNNSHKYNIIKYILCILLASIFHYSFLFYFILLLTKIKKIKNLYFIILPTVFMLMFISYTNLHYKVLSLIFNNDKVLLWFTYRAKIGFIIPIVLQIFSLFFILIIYNNNFIHVKTKLSDMFNFIYIQNIYKVNIIMLLLIPLYIFNMTFFRLYRNILILNYIVVANSKFNINAKVTNVCLKTLYVYYIIILFLYLILYINYSSVFYPIFNDNIVIKFLI